MKPVKNLISALAIGAIAATAGAAQAAWPEKPLNMVIQFSPGGGGDQTLLPLKPLLEKSLGQTVLYNYKPGASSRIGTEVIHASGTDGYTMGGLFLPHLPNSTIFAKPKYSIQDFAPVAIFTVDVPIWFVHKDSPYKDMRDLIADAKKRPGEVKLAIGSFTGEHYITVALVEEQAGVKFRTVNVKGGSKVMSNIVGQHFEVGVSRPSSILRVRDDIRGIGIVADKRDPKYPEAPTFAEMGLSVPALSSSRGIMVSRKFKDSNPQGYAKLVKAVHDAVHSPEYAKTLDRMGLDLAYQGPEEAEKTIMATYEAMKKYPLIDAAKKK
jgi:tripartite-type tricarboxylate transporter receptor subunit TctC